MNDTMSNTSPRRRVFLLVAAMALGTLGTQASAQSGYVTNPGSDSADNPVVRSGTGLCVHTSAWTSALVNAQCDPDRTVGALPTAPMPTPVAAIPVDQTPVTQDYVAADPIVPDRAVPVVVAYVAPPVVEKIILSADTLFGNDKSVIKPAGKAALDDLVGKLDGNARVVLPVGYTSSTGTEAYNMALSIRRADAVKAYLVSQGIDADRIHPSGRGESYPVATNATAAGRAENRRVEIEVMASAQQAKW